MNVREGSGSPPRNLFRVRRRCFYSLAAMFSLFDLEVLCSDEEKTRKFLESYGVLREVSL